MRGTKQLPTARRQLSAESIRAETLLLDLTGDECLRTLKESWTSRVKFVSARAKDPKGLAALLVRPDGFVAWAADLNPDDSKPDLTVLEATLRRWFGSPS